jgi:hypothetical protein
MNHTPWGIVTEWHSVGNDNYEAKLLFANPAWAPDELCEMDAFIEFTNNDIGRISLRDAPPSFGTYDETDVQRLQRLRTAICDAAFRVRYVMVESSKVLPAAPFPFSLAKDQRFGVFAHSGLDLSESLQSCATVVNGARSIAAQSLHRGDQLLAMLATILESSSLADAKFIPVSWGPRARTWGILVSSESPSIVYETDSEPPSERLEVAGIDANC